MGCQVHDCRCTGRRGTAEADSVLVTRQFAADLDLEVSGKPLLARWAQITVANVRARDRHERCAVSDLSVESGGVAVHTARWLGGSLAVA